MALTSKGLIIPRAPEIQEGIQEEQKRTVDVGLTFADDSVLYQIDRIVANRIASAFEAQLGVYDSKNIDKAEGVNLDILAALKDLTRIAAGSSFTNEQRFTGDDGTLVQAGSIFESPSNNVRVTNLSDITLTSGACLGCTLTIETLVDAVVYDIVVNGVQYTTTAGTPAVAATIATGLKADMDTDTNKNFTVTVDDDTLVIATIDGETLATSAISYISLSDVIVKGTLEAVSTGPLSYPEASVTSIISAVPGLTSTSNPVAYISGRDRELDEDFRIRIKNPVSALCTGTVEAIRTGLLENVDGIISVSIAENTTNLPDGDGRPSHSFEAVVIGGDDSDIARQIWVTKPAGNASFGNTLETITDSTGQTRDIRFTRPIAVDLNIMVSYNVYEEEVAPAGRDTVIKQAIYDHINSLGVGVDVIPPRMFKSIYSKLDGIDQLVITVEDHDNIGQPLRFRYDSGVGTPFLQGEPLSWGTTECAGTGILDQLVDNGVTGGMSIRVLSGAHPLPDMEITGTTSSATANVDGIISHRLGISPSQYAAVLLTDVTVTESV